MKGAPTRDYEEKLKTMSRAELIPDYGKIKVGLIGDSIRDIGYSLKLQDYLGSDYVIYKNNENCRFSQYVLRVLFDSHDLYSKCDIITFNAGLWDICKINGDDKTFTDINVYKVNISRIARILLTFTKNVFFITTTPVNPKNIYNDNKDIIDFNNAVIEDLKKMGIKIIDLYSLINSNIDEFIASDNLHLSEKGIDAASKLIASAIKEIRHEN